MLMQIYPYNRTYILFIMEKVPDYIKYGVQEEEGMREE